MKSSTRLLPSLENSKAISSPLNALPALLLQKTTPADMILKTVVPPPFNLAIAPPIPAAFVDPALLFINVVDPPIVKKPWSPNPIAPPSTFAVLPIKTTLVKIHPG